MKLTNYFAGGVLAAAAMAVGILGASGGAYAQECPRGTLDKQYCDRNNDLVADLPLDSSKWVDPSTIIFTYTPVEDPAVYAKVWDGFIKHMEKVTGKKVVFSRFIRMPPSWKRCGRAGCILPVSTPVRIRSR